MSAPFPLLQVSDLSLRFRTRSGIVNALEDVSFQVRKGETVGVVGESGSGKSVTAYTVMGILDNAGEVTQGHIGFGGLDLLNTPENELREIRGREIAMIFQSPRTALNPIRKVGEQIADVLVRHGPTPRVHARKAAIQALATVRIPDPERRFEAYPFELSGGLCQRIGIAMALACSPSLLIADEPTTGLDVTTQASVLDLLATLATERHMATLLITHDLGLAAEYCDHIVVMHAGHVVEAAPTPELFSNPRHPYTAKLITATPGHQGSLRELAAIPGNLPNLRAALPPCRFSHRCERHQDLCDQPPLPRQQLGDAHVVACRRPL